ncbi:rhomboid family intramembrane serine protease [Desulfospira joergensenii]|uniref:rhomboid family intramembrane serine protease n=1 Tax=Desulfospira joergensenii TaxID=53329 RepID=UPI0003B4F725|nr:rhomboid family intramembrane serine protease [Desulfospira joergensenii]
MIPIRDNQPSQTMPVAVYGIIAANLLVFLFQVQAGLDNQAYFYRYGLVPGKYTVTEMSRHFSFLNQLFSMVSYMFLHGGFWHFLGNMWFLYIFGDNIEGHLGSLRFLGFYLLCGLLSGMFHFLLNPVSMVPTIGASGAIAGVMGAYFLLYPRSRILTLVPIIIIPMFIQIPAFVFLGFWFLMQFLNAAGSGGGAGIAWWAHVGGFIAGLLLVKLEKKLPSTGTREKIQKFTRKKHTPKLQAIVTRPASQGGDLHGQIEVSSLEALAGAKKIITIPWGFYKPLYRITIPPGIRQGTKLRLAGMGRTLPGQPKGDLFLTVQIKNAI